MAGKKGNRAKSPAKENKGAPWTFPRHSLEESIKVARAIEDKHGGAPVASADLAKMLGYNTPDWRYLDLLRSANQYGLVEGSGRTATVRLTERGSRIVAPKSPTERQTSVIEAVAAVDLFREITETYKGRLPEEEFLSNRLIKEHNVPRDRVPTFIQVYREDDQFIRGFAGSSRAGPDPMASAAVVHAAAAASNDPPLAAREFLDTCFMMMPFGNYFDIYYSEIYAPSIREAGYEPVRADSIFETGSVVEQIWRQINKCAVVVAELTGKNPNVFYEMGLAHALPKPVVFVSGALEDVPFDLRHLRIVIYDVRMPNWADKLKKEITAYLRETRKSPEDAIPNPFRQPAEAKDV